MSRIRVLRLFHSAVVDEFREREHWLREKHGYDVRVVCPPAWPEGGSVVEAAPQNGVPVHVVPVRGRTHPILFWYSPRALRRVIDEFRPHLIDVHEEPYSLAAALALRSAGDLPLCVYTAQNIHKRYPQPFRALERRVLARATAAYPCSSEAGQVLRRKGFEGALHVLPLGVSEAAARPDSNGTLRVGFVSRLVAPKGGRNALAAFAAAAAGVEAELEIVGSGPEEELLRGDAERLGVAGRVRFAGAVSQEEALARIGSYDVLLVPSLSTARWKEQFGRVAAQALAAGTPVLASASGSLPEVLGGCGELAREGDVPDLADKLGRLLRDPARRAELSARGRARAAEALSWERVADGFDAMYREALGHA
jgi:glycosyltransferase involved in cell wall biosynthesis